MCKGSGGGGRHQSAGQADNEAQHMEIDKMTDL